MRLHGNPTAWYLFLATVHTREKKYRKFPISGKSLVYRPTSSLAGRVHIEARPRERSDRSRFLPQGKKASSYQGAYRVSLYVYFKSMYLCVTSVVFSYCESGTRPISTNPRSMEAGEYELTWDVFRRAVSRWSRSPGCCGFRRVFWVGRIFIFFSSNAHGQRKYEAALPHLPLH